MRPSRLAKPSRDTASGAETRAISRAFPPTGPAAVVVVSLQSKPYRSVVALAAPAALSDSWNVIAPSVRVPVLSVNNTSMLPRSSIVTSRFTSTRFRASLRDPLARLTETIAGSSCGVMPMAIASENRSASIRGRESATLMTKIETQRTPATFTSRPEKSRRPT